MKVWILQTGEPLHCDEGSPRPMRAINLSNKTGDFVLLYEKKYYICDPTYIGAKTGMIMIEYKNMTPKVINFN